MSMASALRRAPKAARNAIRDLRYGAPLGGVIKTRYAHLGAHHTANSDYRDLELLFADVLVSADDVLVDVGCGKGRALNWFLSRYPRNTIYGIEIDPEISARTAARLRRHRNVTIICGDATKLLPDDGTVFYLNNPFAEAVVREFAAAALRTPSPVRIVYNNCKYLGPFLEEPSFTVQIAEAPVRARSALISAGG
jgi:SAM-dependent methyltransferase